MNRKKGLILSVGLLLVLGSPAPNAALAETWNWVLETHGSNVSWTSPTAVDTHWADYDWSAEFIQIEAQLGGALWLDVTNDFGDTHVSGIDHALPFDIYMEHVNEPGTLVADWYHWVDATGQGRFTISNVVFGSLLGNPITGFRGTGETTVTPEPATLSLLALGGLALLRRRK
ncbi:MAG: PEP-CTERM sorting domain-containing protein [Planctomycetota bacterium]|nr:PEP-CTERM sorting domain-containing protein [Planctomycetota bacterium]